MFWFHTTHPETGQPIEVQVEYHRPKRGLRDRFGVPLEPDDGEEFVVCEVWNRAGEPIDCSAFQTRLIEEAITVFDIRAVHM